MFDTSFNICLGDVIPVSWMYQGNSKPPTGGTARSGRHEKTENIRNNSKNRLCENKWQKNDITLNPEKSICQIKIAKFCFPLIIENALFSE